MTLPPFTTTPYWRKAFQLLSAIVILSAVIGQYSFAHNDTTVAQFFSFFTIQSNLLLAGSLLWFALAPAERANSNWQTFLRGAVTLYLLITGLVFSILLANIAELNRALLPWANQIMHNFAPVVALLEWLFSLPQPRLSVWRNTVGWLVYPLLWLAFTLINGVLSDWYPYPFLNPAKAGGYSAVLGYCLAIGVLGIFIALGLVLGNNWYQRKSTLQQKHNPAEQSR